MNKSKTFIIRNNGQVKQNAMGYINKLPVDKVQWQIEVKELVNTRSLAQNKLLFLWLSFISDYVAESQGKYYTSLIWKEYFQDLFLGYEVNPINNKPVLIGTSGLGVKRFSDFLGSIEHYCGSEFEIRDLPHPEYLYIKAMGYY